MMPVTPGAQNNGASVTGVINASSSGNNTTVAAQSGYAIRVRRYTYKVAGAVTVTWKSSGGATIYGPMPFAASGDGMIEDDRGRLAGLFMTAFGEGLVMALNGAVAVGGGLEYEFVPSP